MQNGHSPCLWCLDSMSLTYTKDGNDVSVGLLNTGIAWDTDRDVKFGNPSNFASNGKCCYIVILWYQSQRRLLLSKW